MSIRRVVLAIARLGLLSYFSVKIRTSSSGIITNHFPISSPMLRRMSN